MYQTGKDDFLYISNGNDNFDACASISITIDLNVYTLSGFEKMTICSNIPFVCLIIK